MRHVASPSARELLLIFDKLDDFGPTLLEFAKRNAVAAASFHAIGAMREATIAFWNPETNSYENIAIREQVEVASMMGSLAPSADGIKMHAHIVLGKRDGSAMAGHFVRGVVFPTLEVFLTVRDAKVLRSKDKETGLWLLERMSS